MTLQASQGEFVLGVSRYIGRFLCPPGIGSLDPFSDYAVAGQKLKNFCLFRERFLDTPDISPLFFGGRAVKEFTNEWTKSIHIHEKGIMALDAIHLVEGDVMA